MKGGGVSSSYSLPAKRRWKGLVIAVLGLVFLSMLVPLVFMLGLHNSFHSTIGYGTEQRNSDPVHPSTHTDDLIRRFAPTLPQLCYSLELICTHDVKPQVIGDDVVKEVGNVVKEVGNVVKEAGNAGKEAGNAVKEAGNNTKGSSTPAYVPKQVRKDNATSVVRGNTTSNMVAADEDEMMCELKFGSYCLWRREQKGKMDDSVVKKMKDLLFVARAYYPSIAKLPTLDKLSNEMKQNIQEFERVLSETTTDKDLPHRNKQRITMMEAVIAKAKSCPVDCNNVDKKFRQLVDLTEDEANFHRKQSAFLYKLAVQTMPKSLHCLSMRLTVEYFRSSVDIEHVEHALAKKLVNPDLYHYIIFSRNILASSVAINSTVQHAKESKKQVFHLLTDKENYFAIKLWFSRNKYGDATVQVLNVEGLNLNNHPKVAPLHLPEEFRVSFQIFQSLEKVVVLDDDTVVQRDLSALWNLDMGGKVNGAVQSCDVKLSHLKSYLPSSSFDEDSCSWASGINIIDLSRWRIHNLTKTYQQLVHKMSKESGLSETTTLSASLLTFQGLVYALEDNWMTSGLGYNYGINLNVLEKAAVLHFDGSMKPWLELGIPKYKSFWRKYLSSQNQFLSDCNVNP
ncbi:hypothetical protein CASFOL_040132 [Castilleja foliolosa]|uniref:Hexosyltransferase n=1 Tax=Castilleja foliolosa TaxID=1961234 RepID=A0ABD3BEM0_9LAMI